MVFILKINLSIARKHRALELLSKRRICQNQIKNMELLEFGTALNISPLSAISAILFLFLAILYFKQQHRGPWGLPYLGLWPFLKTETAYLQLQEFTKKYGDVYLFRYAGQLYLHVGSIKAVKETLVTKADCFSERYLGFNVLTSLFHEGLISVNGEAWKVLRKFFVSAFREHGVSSMKDYMSGPILDSVNSTVDELREKNGKPIDIVTLMATRCSAIARRVLFNDDGMSEEELKEFIMEYEKILPAFNNSTILLNGEFAKYFIYPFIKSHKIAVEGHKKAASILSKIVARHETSFDKDNVRNIVDSYIKERNERRNKGDRTAEYFTENALIFSLLQFVGDGISAVAIFVAFFINALLEHPEEQEKLYQELKEVIGADGQPTLQDKTKLPYLNAFLQEVQRTVDFINVFVNMECTKKTTIQGCNVPKGAVVLMNIWACHRDPKIFDEPNKFRPSRYIVEPGQQKLETPIMFGVGKRSCLGEPFVMMQVFLFLITIVKNFRLARPEGNIKKPFIDMTMEICAHPR